MSDAVFEPVAEGICMLDTGMAGQRELNAVYLIEAEEPALIESGPAADADGVLAALSARGIEPRDLAHIAVTHIHLDHSGAAATLARTFPLATVWVHERGAAHLVDPARLVASTARTYGEDRMLRFFGAPEPLAPERLRTIDGGGSIALGDRFLSVLYTPGHASHHVAFVDSATGAVFAGEAVGSHLPWVDVYRPALPPPEADVEAALASIELIASRATMLLTSHYGPIADASDGCARAAEKIREWADAVEQALRTGPDDIDRITGLLRNLAARDYLARSGEPIDLGRYDALGSLRMNAAGLTRYWKKRWEREAGGDQPS